MSWGYDSDPSGSTRDAVRLMIGDTDIDDQLIQDEEIAYFLDQEGTTHMAAARAADAIAAKFSRQADKKVGDLSIAASQRAKAYRDLAADLRSQASKFVTPFAGGISVSNKQSYEGDSDRVKPSMSRVVHDNPDAGSSDADTEDEE